jgi:hypothetical protein
MLRTSNQLRVEVRLPNSASYQTPGINLNSIAGRYHSKPVTAASSAHIGLQTRQDLPNDDIHFKSYSTTAQESFKEPIVDPKFKNAVPVNIGRPSHIHLGDLDKQRSYSTVHDTSFLKHPEDAYKKPTRHGAGSFHAPLNLGQLNIGGESHFTTTTSQSFQGNQTHELSRYKPLVSQMDGRCHISFGDDKQDTRRTELSVTQRDYVMKTAEKIDRTHVVSTIGITKALIPGAHSDYETQNSSVYRPHGAIENCSAAGFVPGAGNGEATSQIASQRFSCSVPNGDTRHFDFDKFGTTNQQEFLSYPLTGYLLLI